MIYNCNHELLIWLPAYLVDEDESAAIDEITRTNGKILEFLDGETVLEDVAETLFDANIDVDDWLQTLRSF